MTAVNAIDITDEVRVGYVDEDCLPLLECACGQKFDPWVFVLSIYHDEPKECPQCHRKMYAVVSVRIMRVVE